MTFVSALFRVFIIKFWLYIFCLPPWCISLLYALLLTFQKDMKRLIINTRLFCLRLINFNVFSFKSWFYFFFKRLFLFFYFIYPLYFFIYLSFYLIIILFKYFIIIFFYILILRQRTSFVKISFYYFYKLKIYHKILLSYFILLNKMVKHDLFNFTMQFILFLILSFFYFVFYVFFPFLLSPFIRFFWFFNRIYIGLKIEYKVKKEYYIDLFFIPIYRKIYNFLYIFYKDWSLALLRFFIKLPLHIWRTFLPMIISLIIFYIFYYIINFIYYLLYYILLFLYILFYIFIYFINMCVFIFINFFYIIFYLFRYIIFYIVFLIYKLIFQILPTFCNINLIKIIYLDFLSIKNWLKSKYDNLS